MSIRFRLSTLLVIVTAAAVLVSAWLSYATHDRSVTLVSQSGPTLTLGSRGAGHSYELSKANTIHTLSVTLPPDHYAPQVFPQIEWSFRLSDGLEHRWICKSLWLFCEKTSPDDAFLMVDDRFNTPYELVRGSSYRIVKHWWVSSASQKSVTQELHLYLIANDSNRILAEHRLSVVVNLVVPDGGDVVESRGQSNGQAGRN